MKILLVLVPVLVLEKHFTSEPRRRPKAAEDCRSPRRQAFFQTQRHCASFWTAPALWRFGGAWLQICRADTLKILADNAAKRDRLKATMKLTAKP